MSDSELANVATSQRRRMGICFDWVAAVDDSHSSRQLWASADAELIRRNGLMCKNNGVAIPPQWRPAKLIVSNCFQRGGGGGRPRRRGGMIDPSSSEEESEDESRVEEAHHRTNNASSKKDAAGGAGGAAGHPSLAREGAASLDVPSTGGSLPR